MTPEEIYNAWAPPESPWSRWAKPVVFAHLAPAANPYVLPPDAVGDPVTASFDVSPIPPADGTTAIVIDLPSATGATLALRLANERGYRPVPLYNAVPAPFSAQGAFGTGSVAVDLRDVMEALRAWADELAALGLPPDAPPAFVLDARRRGAGWVPSAGNFDNRSVSLPTDFPSATFLHARGVRDVILIQAARADERSTEPQPDLAHTLRRWQDAKLNIFLYEIGGVALYRRIDVDKPSWFGHVWHHFLVRARLRRNAMGGFGGFLPVPSEGGSSGFG